MTKKNDIGSKSSSKTLDDVKSFQLEEFLFEYNQHSLIFSSKLKETCFLYENFKKKYIFDNENYKQIQNGAIPKLNTQKRILNNIKNNIYFLDCQDDSQNIFSKLNIMEKLSNSNDNLSFICPECGHKLVKNDDTFLLETIFNEFKNDKIAVGCSTKKQDKINIKELIKSGVFNIIHDNKFYDIDEIKEENISNYYVVSENFILNDKIASKENLTKLFYSLKAEDKNIFIFSLTKGVFKEFNVKDEYICKNCHGYFNNKLLANSSSNKVNVYINNINLDYILNTKFSTLITDNKLKSLTNILNDLVVLGLKDSCFNNAIKNVNTSFVLNFIEIKNKITANDIIVIQNPLSFVNKETLQNMLNTFKNYSVIIFENNEAILSLNFNKKYSLTNNKIDLKYSNYCVNKLSKNRVNIILKNNLNNILNDNTNEFLKTITISPLFHKNTTLSNALNIFSKINDIFLQTVDAKKYGISKKDFLLKSNNKYLCSYCKGKGIVKEFNENYKTCPKCLGNLFNDTLLSLKFKNLTLKEVYNLKLSEALEFFKSFYKIFNPLKMLLDMLECQDLEEFKDIKLNSRTNDLPNNLINLINIFSNFDRLQNSNLFIIENAFSFLSNSEKIRFINILENYIKTNTIILEAI